MPNFIRLFVPNRANILTLQHQISHSSEPELREHRSYFLEQLHYDPPLISQKIYPRVFMNLDGS